MTVEDPIGISLISPRVKLVGSDRTLMAVSEELVRIKTSSTSK